jgi:hypothetical protein
MLFVSCFFGEITYDKFICQTVFLLPWPEAREIDILPLTMTVQSLEINQKL